MKTTGGDIVERFKAPFLYALKVENSPDSNLQKMTLQILVWRQPKYNYSESMSACLNMDLGNTGYWLGYNTLL